MTTDQVTEVWSTIGNLIRIAAVIEVSEVTAACEAARSEPLSILLLDPHRSPQSDSEHALNRQLLAAFARFRFDIECIRQDL